MRSRVAYVAIIIVMVACLSIPSVPLVDADTNGITINSYVIDVEVDYKTFDFVSTCRFKVSGDLHDVTWRIATGNLEVTDVKLDGIGIDYRTEPYYTHLKPSNPIESGLHELTMDYSGVIDVNHPPSCRLQVFSGENHFHCYNAWFPVCDSAQFAQSVLFDVNVEIPPHWYLLGSYIPKEYRDKPNPTGKYHFTVEKENVYSMKLIGGEYSLYKEEIEGGTLRIYTFKGDNAKKEELADATIQAMQFYSDYYQHPCDDDFFICAQTGRRGNGQGLDGGYTIDSPYLSDLSIPFLAHETAHVSWFGGTGIIGSRDQPNERFFSEAFAEFSCALFCEEGYNGDREANKYDELLKQFHDNKKNASVMDPNYTWNDAVMYTKGGLVLWALRGYVGDPVFRQSMIQVFDEYALDRSTGERKRITFEEFKAIIEENYGDSIDDFWKVFFEGKLIVDVDYEIDTKSFEGKASDYLVVHNNEYTLFPLKFRVFYIDGTSEVLTVIGENKCERLEKKAVGLEFLSYNEIIPKPENVKHTLSTATIETACTWREPLILIDDGEDDVIQDRATLWQERYGGDIEYNAPDELPERPVILLGETMQMKYLIDSIDIQPVHSRGDYLRWIDTRIDGHFATTGLVPVDEYRYTPIIMDSDIGEIPDDLNCLVIFRRDDGARTISYVSKEVGSVVAPRSKELLDIIIDDRIVKRKSSYLTFYLEPKGDLTLEYEGLHPNEISIGKHTIELEPGKHDIEFYLKYDQRSSNVKITNTYKELREEWDIEYQLKDGVDEPDVLETIKVPEYVPRDTAEIKWMGNHEFIYSIDNKEVSDWSRGTNLRLYNLSQGKHVLKMVFIDDEILSDVFESEFLSGVNPPTIVFDDSKVYWANGEIKVTGKTKPGVILDPPGAVDENGNFKVIVKSNDPPQSLNITATDEYGLTVTETIEVRRLIQLTMHLGETKVTGLTETWTLDVPPQLVNGSTYVPMRFIGERLGADVTWIASDKKVVYRLENTIIELFIGKDQAFINGIPTVMPGKPVIISGRTLVPVRFVSEALGAKVTWFGEEKRIVVEYPNLDL